MKTGWSQEKKQRAARFAPKGCHFLRPDSRIVERPGWYQLITPSDPAPSANEVLFAELEDGEADEAVARTIAEYEAHELSFKWCVSPFDRPADLSDRLARRGFVSWKARAMACHTALRLGTPDAAQVERIAKGTLELYLEAAARGWQMHPSEVAVARAALAKRLDDDVQLFVARIDGAVVGTAGTFLKEDGSAYLVAANVLPDFRGRGIYRALLEGRLAALRDAGVELATTQAREHSSAPMLQHLGFETLFELRVHQRNPRPRDEARPFGHEA